MSERAPLRVVATHDFCCAYPPLPTSYDSLPGGEGLKNTVDAVAHVERVLGRPVGWQRTGVGLREAVGRALS